MLEPIFPIAVDNSMRKELVKCEKAAFYKYECGLRSIEQQRVDLHAGKAFARGMEAMRLAYYKQGLSQYESLQAGVKALYAEYGGFIPPPKSNKTADRMAGALAYYAEQNRLDEEKLVPMTLGGELAVEVSFNYVLPLSHPVTMKPLVYCGRFDMLARDIDTGDVWVVDEKTTSQMGEKWANQWLLDSQMTGYCWGARKLLEQHGWNPNLVKGAIINGIAIRLRDYEHGRFPTYRQAWEVERWFQQMLVDMREWVDAHVSKSYRMNLDHACAQYNNPCEFAPLCKSANPERLIDGSYEVKRWNPITREES